MKFRGNSKSTYSIIIFVCIVGFWLFENFYTPKDYSNNSLETTTTFPAQLLPSSTTNAIVQHTNYTLSYNEPYEQAEWVAYTLKKEHLTYDKRKRPYFIEDPYVRTTSADWRNYKGSGFDRGHLCPAGDRKFSKEAYDETFYTSNISPQDRDFNAGIWNVLENKVRLWAKKYTTVHVITGGILEVGLRGIGTENVAVPNYFYKIIVRQQGDEMIAIAFLFPAQNKQKPLQSFAVPIDLLEERTNIDFLEGMALKDQTTLEKEVRLKDWQF